jgi:hypothetical protein
VVGLLTLWMVFYGRRARRQGERLAAQAAAAQSAPEAVTPALAVAN